MSKFGKFDLQLFAGEEDDKEVRTEGEETQEGGEGEEEKPAEEGETISKTQLQEEINKAIGPRLAREKSKQEKHLEKLFGTKNLEEAAEYYKAGRAVADASGKSPSEVMDKVKSTQAQKNPQSQSSSEVSELKREINELKNMTMEQQEKKAKEAQIEEARKEYGELYDQNQYDIEDMAEDRNLNLVDAAAVVLRPHLKEVYSKQAQAKKDNTRKKVDSTDEAPSKGVDVNAQLSAEEKRVAKNQGISYKEYHNWKYGERRRQR